MKKRNIKNMLTGGQVRASLTVEAAVIVPVILFTVTGGINIGYDMFQQAKTTAEIHEELEKLDPVEIVRRNTLIQNLSSRKE